MKNQDLILRAETSKNAKGGTELMQEALYDRLPRELLERYQIWFSRFDESTYDQSKRQILYVHDLPGDPMYDVTLRNSDFRQRLSKIVFVSNWQMQKFIDYYGLNWSECFVMRNAIVPIGVDWDKKLNTDTVKVIYHTTPHRGLNILYHVFDMLSKKYPVELDVYSSFKIYGWDQRDEPFKELFEKIKNHPNMTYHGTVPNEEVKKALTKSHIFAYPSIWAETSCISLIEAMSAGNVCVHPNWAALPETSGGLNVMYQMHEDINHHAGAFLGALEAAIDKVLNYPQPTIKSLQFNKIYVDGLYNWDVRALEWKSFLEQLDTVPRG